MTLQVSSSYMTSIGASITTESLFVLRITRDGVWDAEEVEAIYGVHHVYSQKKSKVTAGVLP